MANNVRFGKCLMQRADRLIPVTGCTSILVTNRKAVMFNTPVSRRIWVKARGRNL